MSERSPDLTIAIVSYRDLAELRACLRSLAAHPPSRPFEVWVVDNEPGSGTAAVMAHEFPWVRTVSNERNAGFSRANNQVLRATASRYALLLNSDTEVLPGSLDTLCEFLDAHPRAGVVGPQLLNSDGSLQPSGNRLRTRAEELWWALPVYRWLGRSLSDRFRQRQRDYSLEAEVDEISGAAMLLRRETLEEVGLLDEELFFSYEDVELCVRARAAGWRVWYCPRSRVIHHWGRSTSRAGGEIRQRALASQLRFYEKVYGRWFTRLMKFLICLRSLAGMASLAPALLTRRQETVIGFREWAETLRTCLRA